MFAATKRNNTVPVPLKRRRYSHSQNTASRCNTMNAKGNFQSQPRSMNLIQTKLSFVSTDALKPSSKLVIYNPLQCRDTIDYSDGFLMPIHTSKAGDEPKNGQELGKEVVQEDSKSLNIERGNLVVLMGNVNYCLQMHKANPTTSVMWDVYGKIIRILNGQYKLQSIFLIRNERGPVLQCICYKFDHVPEEPSIGKFVRAVGKFIGENRLRAFKIETVEDDIFTKCQFLQMQAHTSGLHIK